MVGHQARKIAEQNVVGLKTEPKNLSLFKQNSQARVFVCSKLNHEVTLVLEIPPLPAEPG